MKRIKKPLFAALIALPILMISSAKANNGHDKHFRGGERERRMADDDRDSRQGSSVPIDGGLSILLAAGIGLGVKKVAAHRKLKKQAATI